MKPADSEDDMYTGVLQYREYLFESIGRTRDLAKTGKYTVRSVRQMTEIFLYDKGPGLGDAGMTDRPKP